MDSSVMRAASCDCFIMSDTSHPSRRIRSICSIPSGSFLHTVQVHTTHVTGLYRVYIGIIRTSHLPMVEVQVEVPRNPHALFSAGSASGRVDSAEAHACRACLVPHTLPHPTSYRTDSDMWLKMRTFDTSHCSHWAIRQGHAYQA